MNRAIFGEDIPMTEHLFSRIKRFFSQADLLLLALCVGASLFGILLIASATHYTGSLRYVAVQSVALVLGIGLYAFFSFVDVEEASEKWKWIFVFNVGFILLLLTPLGISAGGNRAWLSIPGFPMDIQPAEIVKVTFIILLAKQLAYYQERDLSSVTSVAFYGGHFLFMVGLLYVVSGDAGSCLVYAVIFIFMTFAAGVKLRWFVLGGGGLAAALVLAWNTGLFPGYMRRRIEVILDHSLYPMNEGWHQGRSLIAFGSGGWFGQGLFNGTQTQQSSKSSLPARHTDFIFSVAGEELGYIGCIAIIAILVAIIVRCLVVARRAKTPMGSLICVGVAAMLSFQMIENIGMCIFVMPVIGLTLPFFSYGGSSLLTVFAAMGIVSGIKVRSLPEWLRD